ncbi:MAG: hypothetical protein GWN58_41070, partial [Anaerolineae bacterium]|nr:hypothetical protein [Anaerolineae bacterium]
DAMASVEEYADAVGAPASIMTSEEMLAAEQEAQAQQMGELQAQQGMAMAGESIGQVADAAKTLSETDTAGQNLLTDMAGGV